MNIYHDMQRRFYGYNYPDRLTTFRIVHNARAEVEKQERTLRSEARLWERRVTDEDFGAVRLGMGTLPSTVTYDLGEWKNLTIPKCVRPRNSRDSRYVSEIPVIVSLRRSLRTRRGGEKEKKKSRKKPIHPTPVTHALGIAGERQSVYAFTRAMLAHYVVFHAPMDAKLYVLAPVNRNGLGPIIYPTARRMNRASFCALSKRSKKTKTKKPLTTTRGAIGQFWKVFARSWPNARFAYRTQ